jgi:ABC-type sugar transport system permease subunit
MLSAVVPLVTGAELSGQASGRNQFYVMRRFIVPLSSALSELITLGGTHLMLCPPLFVYLPIVWGFFLSFFEARNTVAPTTYVGLTNYIELFNDPRFIDSLLMIIGFSVFIVPVTFAISLGLALLVNSVSRGQGFFRTTFFIPVACSYVVASVVWKMSLFNGLPSGLANNVLWWVFGANPIAWINTTDPPLFWVVLVTARLWLQTGFYMIIFLAGLQEIPKSLYEAAAVDGAERGWKSFRYITFPLLRNTSISVLLLLFIEAFQAFDGTLRDHHEKPTRVSILLAVRPAHHSGNHLPDPLLRHRPQRSDGPARDFRVRLDFVACSDAVAKPG